MRSLLDQLNLLEQEAKVPLDHQLRESQVTLKARQPGSPMMRRPPRFDPPEAEIQEQEDGRILELNRMAFLSGLPTPHLDLAAQSLSWHSASGAQPRGIQLRTLKVPSKAGRRRGPADPPSDSGVPPRSVTQPRYSLAFKQTQEASEAECLRDCLQKRRSSMDISWD